MVGYLRSNLLGYDHHRTVFVTFLLVNPCENFKQFISWFPTDKKAGKGSHKSFVDEWSNTIVLP